MKRIAISLAILLAGCGASVGDDQSGAESESSGITAESVTELD